MKFVKSICVEDINNLFNELYASYDILLSIDCDKFFDISDVDTFCLYFYEFFSFYKSLEDNFIEIKNKFEDLKIFEIEEQSIIE